MPMATPEKQRTYQRTWLQNRRKAFFAGKVCVVCGSSENLELDHVDPSQKVHHHVWSWSKARREKELSKCQVLCSGCHKEKHASLLRKHGISCYQIRKCRCLVCKTAKSAALKRETRRKAEGTIP